jgi:hypothetical protein
MMYFLKLIAALFERRNEVAKAQQAIYQSAFQKLIVNKVNFLKAILRAAVTA